MLFIDRCIVCQALLHEFARRIATLLGIGADYTERQQEGHGEEVAHGDALSYPAFQMAPPFRCTKIFRSLQSLKGGLHLANNA